MKKTIATLLLYILVFTLSVNTYQSHLANPKVSDAGRLLPTKVKSIHSSTSDAELVDLVKKANKNDDIISIAGMQHSQGGHTYYPNGIMLDMKEYNKILEFNPEDKTITVQSGVTWDDIQRKINPYGLAIKVMQSQNIFTVGGSISVNAHGRDIQNGALIDTIKSFRLLQHNGTIINVSKNENAELFSLVVGGYGLFGVILDITLTLTDDELYQIKTKTLDYRDYSRYFNEEVRKNETSKMHLARISVAPETFLKEMYVTDYVVAADQQLISEHNTLMEDNAIAAPKFLLGLSRYSEWGKNIFWESQKLYMNRLNEKYETRNNVMRSNSAFMEYENSNKTEVLQEYFVPVENFSAYIDDLREVLEQEELNLLNITIRFVEKNNRAVLSYAKADMFALVLLINQSKSSEEIEHTKMVIQKMIDVVLKHQGSYYLPYYHYPTKEQLQEAYPRIDEFFEKKRKYDVDERFMNIFYEEYGK